MLQPVTCSPWLPAGITSQREISRLANSGTFTPLLAPLLWLARQRDSLLRIEGGKESTDLPWVMEGTLQRVKLPLGSFWGQTGERMSRRPEGTEEKKLARKELRAVADDLRGLHFRLLGITASLPAREDEVPRETDLELEEYSEATEMRLAIQCVLRDQIEPAITSLRDAAKYRAPKTRKGKR